MTRFGALKIDARHPRPSGDASAFALWQPAYAERGIATFPVRDNKVPAIRGYQKVGLRGSRELAHKFADAGAFGFMCGPRSRVTVLDVDTGNEQVLADALGRRGATPILVLTASGKWHAWYRHNGEGRCIRPWPDLDIDILGARGFVVAPPSRMAHGRYQFAQGSLDDFDHLPVMRLDDARDAGARRQEQDAVPHHWADRQGNLRGRRQPRNADRCRQQT
jgi:hypothetical protein